MENSTEEIIWDWEINKDDAIEILNDTLKKFEVRGAELYMVQKAIKYILSDYKKEVKEAKKYKNMYKAEHEIHLVRNEQLDRKENAVIKCKELENENEAIKEANDYWRSRYCEISNNSIPIQKIKDKIEEVEKEKLNYSEDEWYLESEIKGYAIDRLQELLGSEDKDD